MIDIVSKRYWFLAISLLVIVPGVLAVLFGGLKQGIDFTGGTRWEVIPKNAQANDVAKFRTVLTAQGYGDAQIKQATIGSAPVTTNTIVMDLQGDLKTDPKAKLEDALVGAGLVAGTRITETVSVASPTPVAGTATAKTTGTVAASSTATTAVPAGAGTATISRNRMAPASEVDFNSIGPVIGQELLGRALLAILAASAVILVYLTLVFRKVPNSFRYGVCAIIALLHDVFVVVGVFAILGLLFYVEIDALFVTAMLTIIGFSVHDTIVVFDRVRENIMKRRFEQFEDTVNYSLVQTLARSINTSVTVLLTLLALFLFGGASIHYFVLALLIGIISGTYSSIFNASMLLVIWENHEWKSWFRRPAAGTASTPATR